MSVARQLALQLAVSAAALERAFENVEAGTLEDHPKQDQLRRVLTSLNTVLPVSASMTSSNRRQEVGNGCKTGEHAEPICQTGHQDLVTLIGSPCWHLTFPSPVSGCSMRSNLQSEYG